MSHVPVCAAEHAAANIQIMGSSLTRFPGVYPLALDPGAARLCGDHLFRNWVSNRLGTLRLGDTVLHGYNTYRGTLKQPANSDRQRKDTLLIAPAHVPVAMARLPGFAELDAEATRGLARHMGMAPSRLKLEYGHALHQCPKSARASLFDWHRDTDVGGAGGTDVGAGDGAPPRDIEFTVIVKLNDDKVGASPSRMIIAAASEPFSYGAAAGSTACFRSALWHASVMPASPDACIKLALFYSVVPEPEPEPQRLFKRLRKG